ncbi:epsin-3 [Rosa sericea]
MFLDHFKKQASHFLQERYKTARLTFTDVTPAELWAEEATNGEPCSPDAKTMTKIAAASFEMEDYWRIVDILHRKLYNIDWKEWRQSYKALVLLEFLLTHGPEDFAEEFQGDSEVIQELGSFKHIDDKGFNWGSSMQKKSDQILILLRGGPTLREARFKALKLTNEIQGFRGSVSSPSPSSTPSSAYSETPRASSFSSFSTTSSVWNELNNELSKFHEPSTTKSEAMESYSQGGLRDTDDDHDHYKNTSNFPAPSESREGSHLWNCPPIEEKGSLLESEEEDDEDDDKYYEKEDGILSGIYSKLVNLSPTRGNGPHGNIRFRSVSDVGRELRKKKLDRQSSFWY